MRYPRCSFPPKWSAKKFDENEKDLIRATWRKLVEGEHLDFGEGTTAKRRMDRLIEAGLADSLRDMIH